MSSNAFACVVLLVALGPLAHAWTRDLQATNIISNTQVPYNRTVMGGDPLGQLPLDDSRLQRTVQGLAPEQVQQETKPAYCAADLPLASRFRWR
jgi:hypothetical protein